MLIKEFFVTRKGWLPYFARHDDWHRHNIMLTALANDIATQQEIVGELALKVVEQKVYGCLNTRLTVRRIGLLRITLTMNTWRVNFSVPARI